jgi:hypothetical protein
MICLTFIGLSTPPTSVDMNGGGREMDDVIIRYSLKGEKGLETFNIEESHPFTPNLRTVVRELEIKLKEKAISAWIKDTYGAEQADHLKVHFK